MGIFMLSRAKDHSAVLLIGGTVLIVIVAAIFLVVSQLHTTTLLYLGNGVFDADIVTTEAGRVKGLGGVESMTSRQAMIFVFPSDGIWKMWMKDMKVPIDIVWLDKFKKVIYSVKNASPEDSTNVTFAPTSLARYVIEVPQGTVESQHIRTGSTAVFDIGDRVVE